MSVELTTKFAPKTDELFKAESKISLLNVIQMVRDYKCNKSR